MHSGLSRRFKIEMESSYFKVAASLHPRFRLNWVSEHDQMEVQTLVYKALLPFEEQRPTVEVNAEDCAANSFFWRFEKRAKVNSNVCSSSSLQSVWLDWCKTQNDLPEELRRPFIKYNTTLPSSAAVERLFSVGKRVMSSNRTQMSDFTFEKMVMLASLAKQQ